VSREVIPVWIEPKPDREYFDYTGVAWCFSVFGPKGLCFSGYLKSHIIGILISSPIARREAFTILSYFAFWYNWNSPGLTKHAVIRTAVALTGQEFRSSPKNQSNCQFRSRVQLLHCLRSALSLHLVHRGLPHTRGKQRVRSTRSKPTDGERSHRRLRCATQSALPHRFKGCQGLVAPMSVLCDCQLY